MIPQSRPSGARFSDPATWPDLVDCDLLLGRDITTGRRFEVADLMRELASPWRRGGVLSSLRALQFDLSSGNAEVRDSCGTVGLVAATCLELRDLLGSEAALDGAGPGPLVVRLAPGRQDCLPGYPTWSALLERVTSGPHLLLVEGDLRVVGPALSGFGAQVVFLDAHFYHLGDFLALARREPGFHVSTRLLNGPDSIDLIRRHAGVERLVFGSRPGFHEARSAIERIVTADLPEVDLAAVAGGTLNRLLGNAEQPKGVDR